MTPTAITLLSPDRQTVIRDAARDFEELIREPSITEVWELRGRLVGPALADSYQTQQVIQIEYQGADTEHWRIERLPRRRGEGGGASVVARPLWYDLTRTTAHLFVDGAPRYTITIAGLTAQAALERILSDDLGCDRSLFRPGSVEAAVNAPEVFLAAEHVSHYDLLNRLARAVGGELSFAWDATNGWYNVDLLEQVGDADPGTRVITETGANKNLFSLSQEADAQDAFSRVVASAGNEAESVPMGRAWWTVDVVNDQGDDTHWLTLTEDAVFSETDFPATQIKATDGQTYDIVEVEAPNRVRVSSTSTIGFITFRFLDSNGNAIHAFESSAAVAEIGRADRRVRYSNIAPVENLLVLEGISADLSDFSCAGSLGQAACGWRVDFAQGWSETTAEQDVQYGTKSLKVDLNEGDRVFNSSFANLLPREEEGPYVSAWINMRVLSGSVRVELDDAGGGFFPEGEKLTVSDPRLQSYALEGFAPEGSGVMFNITAEEDGTQIVIDAATITQSATAYAYQPHMGASSAWIQAGELLTSGAGRPPDALQADAVDLGALGLVSDDFNVGDAVTVELADGTTYVRRIISIRETLGVGERTARKTISLARAAPTAAARLRGDELQGTATARASAVSGGGTTVFTGVPESRTLTAGAGLLIDGLSSADLSTDRTITLNVGPQFTFASGALHIADDAISDTHIAWPLVSVDIDGGTIDGTVIGANAPDEAAHTFVAVGHTLASRPAAALSALSNNGYESGASDPYQAAWLESVYDQGANTDYVEAVRINATVASEADVVNWVTGATFEAWHAGTGTVGQLTSQRIVVQNKGGGHVDEVRGLSVEARNLFAGSSATTIAGLYFGDYMGATNNADAPTNFYAIYLPDGNFYNTGPNAWAIYDKSGLPSRFDGAVHVGGNTDVGGTLTVTDIGSTLHPDTSYAYDIGSPQKKWLTLHAAELRVATLVAADELVTMGGRQVVGTSTELIAPVGTSDTTIDVRHNNLSSGDWIRLEAGGQFEEMQITSSATTITGGYRYSVTRNADGTGANSWEAGSAVWNLGGTAGFGFIDQYAVQSFHTGKTTAGPATAYMVRTGTGRTDVDVRALSGNLNGWYGFSSDTYGFAAGDPAGTNFVATPDLVALRHKTDPMIRLTGDGDAFVERRIELSSNGKFTDENNNFSIDSNGITLAPNDVFSESRSLTIGPGNTGAGYILRIWAGPNASSTTTLQTSNTLEISTADFTGGVENSDLYLSSASNTYIRQIQSNEDHVLKIFKRRISLGHETQVTLLSSRRLMISSFDGDTSNLARMYVRTDGTSPNIKMETIPGHSFEINGDGIRCSGAVGIGGDPPSSNVLRAYGSVRFDGDINAPNLPSSNPGTSGRIWYDPNDNNRVKYVP